MMGCDLVVMNRDIEEKSDLVKDLIAIVTSFCCRLYGMRKGQVKAHAIRKEIECVEPVKSV